MQYLIRTIEHNGETFTDVITVRDNERYQVVEAESKAQALNYNEVSGDKNNFSVEEMKRRLRKDSE